MAESWCEIHNQEMTLRQGKYGEFYSHRTDDPKFSSGWCSGKPPKKTDEQRHEELMNDLRKLYKAIAENNKILRSIQIVSSQKMMSEDVDPKEIDI